MHTPRSLVLRVGLWLVLFASLGARAGDPGTLLIGLARRDITPNYPIRITGYAARTNMAQSRAQTLWAKAMVLGSDREHPRVLVSVDNCGVPARVVEEVARRVRADARVRREDFVVASSHTHSAPMLRGFAENIFVRDLTPEEASASDRYTAEMMDHLEAVVRAALRDRRPGRLFWAQGGVGFAANRRTGGGVLDQSLPILVAKDLAGGFLGIVANYACHCTTLGHQVNQHHGDWAGFAQEAIETDHRGVVAMITIGCGADSNPSPRGGDDFGTALARQHGRALAAEVGWLVGGELEALPRLPKGEFRRFDLPFQKLPERAEWEARAREQGIVGYHARKNLARLDRGESLPARWPYFVQSWTFQDRLAMVFLAGEVVVDYSLRLKREYAADRLWVTGYANDVPCYIPSRRVLSEGGYEAESSLWYYDRPARFSPAIENLIHSRVREIMPDRFRAVP